MAIPRTLRLENVVVTAERSSRAGWTGYRPKSGLPELVPTRTGLESTEVGRSVRELSCQTAGTEIACRITGGGALLVGGRGRLWILTT